MIQIKQFNNNNDNNISTTLCCVCVCVCASVMVYTRYCRIVAAATYVRIRSEIIAYLTRNF